MQLLYQKNKKTGIKPVLCIFYQKAVNNTPRKNFPIIGGKYGKNARCILYSFLTKNFSRKEEERFRKFI